MYRAKEITKKVYNDIMNSIKGLYKNEYCIINSKNSKTSDTHRLLLSFTDKIILMKSDKYVALSKLSMHYTWTNIKVM